MRRALVAVVLVALAAPGCKGWLRPGRTGAGHAADDGGAPAAQGDCEARRAEIRALIAAAPRACATNADCSMYPGGPVNCGGVVDKATAARVWELTTAFRERQCGFAVHCGPRAVQAVCRNSRCLEEQLGMPGGRKP